MNTPTTLRYTETVNTSLFTLFKQGFERSAAANDATAENTDSLWQLFRMARGSDSLSPAVTDRLARMAG